jgi:hypothetical protein
VTITVRDFAAVAPPPPPPPPASNTGRSGGGGSPSLLWLLALGVLLSASRYRAASARAVPPAGSATRS